jgi:hypothetical protein
MLDIILCAGCYVAIMGLTIWAVSGRKEENEKMGEREDEKRRIS